MQLQAIDIVIIVGYLILTIIIGFYISKRASANMESYFLGGNSMPWYILGISNASGMFDITGTMWLVALIFVYGVKSIWIPWLWPVFNQIFLMVFLSMWLRRSNVMTGAEWINTRFGDRKDAKFANIIVIVFALVSVIGFLAYAFQGIGKFSYTFLPHSIESSAFGTIPLTPNVYGLIFIGITAIYVIKGGMYSVVLTEVLQFAIMTIASISVGVIAIFSVSPETIQAIVPDDWHNIFFGWKLTMDWQGTMASVNDKIVSDGYELFTFFFVMMVFKGVLVSLAGPAPNYDMQRVLATKSPKEAAMMSGFVTVALFFPRYMLIAGIAVMGLVGLHEVGFDPIYNAAESATDFELVLPYVIKTYLPVGLLGLLLAGLLAAFMSTVAATVNAAPAYLVNDIYKKYIRPDATEKTYVRMSYLATIAIVIIGVTFGYATDSINQVTQWIVNALFGGYAIANVLKWYWWRLNGYGYFWGMATGIAASLLLPYVDVSFIPLTPDLAKFPIMLIISLIGCLAGSYLTAPQPMAELVEFYKTVRPWGFWKPVHDQAVAEDPGFVNHSSFRRDMVNVLVGIVWQTSIITLPVYLILGKYVYLFAGLAVTVLASWVLKRNWYDKLEEN
ncbi:MAG: sodium:solute symporter family protein [Bacteroidia bacterium]